MSWSKKALLITTLILMVPGVIYCQSNTPEKIAILPFTSIGVDDLTMESAESILRMEITRLSNMEIVSRDATLDTLGDEFCNEEACAIALGKKLMVSKILVGNFAALGEKIVVHYLLIDVPGEKTLLKEKTTALYVEDLDAVMKRIALSLVNQNKFAENAEVGNITADETVTPRRRTSNKLTGFTFGYLYPNKGYDGVDRSFSVDFRIANELDDYEIGMLIAARKGFAINLYGSYLFTKTDVCPYLGAAFGFHWVSHETYYDNYYYSGNENRDRKDDGFELTANSGLKLFRTYNFQLIANLAYSYTFNDWDDQALVFTLGVLR